MNIKRMAAALGFLVASAFAATAAPIAAGSTIGFTGNYQAQNPAGTPSTLATATYIDFGSIGGGSPGSPAGTGTVIITTATGSFTGSGLFLNFGTIKDFSLSASSISSFLTAPIASPVFNLDLTTLTSGYMAAPTPTIAVDGNALLTLTGYDPTPGTYALSFQTAGGADVVNPTYTFTFSANSVAVAPVPEPASLALFGAGLLGLGLVRRNRRQA